MAIISLYVIFAHYSSMYIPVAKGKLAVLKPGDIGMAFPAVTYMAISEWKPETSITREIRSKISVYIYKIKRNDKEKI